MFANNRKSGVTIVALHKLGSPLPNEFLVLQKEKHRLLMVFCKSDPERYTL